MTRFTSLLAYYFTWRSLTFASAVLGLVFFVLAVNAMLILPSAAFLLSLAAAAFLLFIPYLTAPVTLRRILGSRRLALVPHLPLAAGLALLFLTLLTAAFLPLAGNLAGVPALGFWFGVKLFILASLYAGALQVTLTSRYMALIFSYAPLALIIAGSLLGPQLRALWANNVVVTVLALGAVTAWTHALFLLATKRNFKPLCVGAQSDLDHWTASLAALLRIDETATANPAGSLLLGYPAGVARRLLTLSYAMVFTPLLSALMVWFTDEDGEGPMMGMRLFLVASFLLTLIVTWLDGETVVRARLLWLRTPGGRPQVWHRLERELWTGHLLRAGIAVTVALVGAWLSDIPLLLLLHFPLVIVTCSLYESYLNLCARLYQWSALAQALAMLISLGVIAAATYYGARFVAASVLLLLEASLVLAALTFRTLAKAGFASVDWQLLRLALIKRPDAVSA